MLFFTSKAFAVVYNATESLTLFQKIQTTQARDLESFNIDNTTYMVIASYPNSRTKLYQWDEDGFTSIQQMGTTGAVSVKHFAIEDAHYLAIAYYIGVLALYQWEGTSFELIDYIITRGSEHVEYFNINGIDYLLVSWNGSNCILYRIEEGEFVAHQTLPVISEFNTKYYKINQEHFISVLNPNGYHYILKWDNNIFSIEQTIYYENTIPYSVDFFSENGNDYLI